MKAWYVYILRCADGRYYAGHTENVPQRVQIHNDGRAATFTRSRNPVTLVSSEAARTEADAMRRERQIKKWTRARKEALSADDPDLLRSLSKSRD